MAILLDGDALAATLRADMAAQVLALKARGITPCLVTVLVGDDPASRSYVGRKHADCAALGIQSREVLLPQDCSADLLSAEIAALNADDSVHGFLVQLPLPAHLDEARHLAEVSPHKDIDGLHPINLGALLAGHPTVLPCTPNGIMTLLQAHDIALAGKTVVIVGRGPLVGRPLAMLLSLQGIDATVILAHRQTHDLAALTRQADVVICAVGQPDLIRADMLRDGVVAIGVGITYDDQGKMVSDLADDVAAIASHVTPRHGSVGALTRAKLLQNLLDFASRSEKGAAG